MLIGYTFDSQLFTSEAFAKFQNTFTNGQSGIIDGCNLSNTSNKVTIADGWLDIQGRFLREQGGTTLSIGNDGYYELVCEIDLNKTNTETSLLQAAHKLLFNASAYPTLTQEDLNNSGKVYQYEFARFRVSSGNITNFEDRRTYLNFEGIYKTIREELEALEQQSNVITRAGGTITGDLKVEGELDANAKTADKLATARNIAVQGAISGNVDFDGSGNVVMNTTQSNIAIVTGTVTTPAAGSETTYGAVQISYPKGFTQNNCTIISLMCQYGNRWMTTGGTGTSTEIGAYGLRASMYENNISVQIHKVAASESSKQLQVRVVLMKIS